MLITLREAAAYSGYSYHALRKRAERGVLRAHKMGVQWFISNHTAEALRQTKIDHPRGSKKSTRVTFEVDDQATTSSENPKT